MSGNSSASITLESPKRSSIWMNLPPGTGILGPTCAPNACRYHSAARAAPRTTRCGVMVWVGGELARSIPSFIGSSTLVAWRVRGTDQHTHVRMIQPAASRNVSQNQFSRAADNLDAAFGEQLLDKGDGLAYLAGGTLVEAIDGATAGIRRVRRTPHLPGVLRIVGSVCDPDGLLDGGRVVQHREHGVGRVSAGDRVGTRHVPTDDGPVPAGQRLVHQIRWPHDRPLRAAAPDLVLHRGQIRVHRPREDADQRQQDPAVDKALAVGHRADRDRAHRHQAPYAACLHRGQNPAGRGRGDRAVLAATRADSRDRGIAALQRRAQRLRVAQAGDRHHLQRGMAHVEPGRVTDHCRHLVPGVQRLSHDLPANATGRSKDRYLHLLSLPIELVPARPHPRSLPGCIILRISEDMNRILYEFHMINEATKALDAARRRRRLRHAIKESRRDLNAPALPAQPRRRPGGGAAIAGGLFLALRGDWRVGTTQGRYGAWRVLATVAGPAVQVCASCRLPWGVFESASGEVPLGKATTCRWIGAARRGPAGGPWRWGCWWRLGCWSSSAKSSGTR